MRQIIKFLVIFVMVLIGAYMQAVWFPKTNPKIAISKSNNYLAMDSGTPHSEIDASGMAAYIGKSQKEVQTKFGATQYVSVASTGEKVLTYTDKHAESHYFQVFLKNDRVSSIFVLGKKDPITPFKIGMKLSDVGDFSTINPDFSFDIAQQVYQFELTEEEMNYTPLIAFTNQSFALLYFGHNKGELQAIRYVDKQSLLGIMPYELTAGKAQMQVTAPKAQTEVIDKINLIQLFETLKILNQRESQHSIKETAELSNQANQFLQEFMKTPTDYLHAPNELISWNKRTTEPKLLPSFWLDLSNSGMLQTEGPVFLNQTKGFIFSVAKDIPSTAMMIHEIEMSQKLVERNKDTTLGIAVSNGTVLILWQNK